MPQFPSTIAPASNGWIPGSEMDQPHCLECLDVWGGSQRTRREAYVTGMKVWIWSEPASANRGGDVYMVSMCGGGKISRFLLADGLKKVSDTLSALIRPRKLEAFVGKSLNHDDLTMMLLAPDGALPKRQPLVKQLKVMAKMAGLYGKN
ncbi:hypothetical protein JYU15_01545 [bacterium AH-315-I18]|nr:hypothetical protein [bacterium AH-315-I18]